MIDTVATVPVWMLMVSGAVHILAGLLIYWLRRDTSTPNLPGTVYELRVVPHAWPGTVAESFSGGFFYERDLAISVGIQWTKADASLTYYLRHVAMLEAGECDPQDYAPAGYFEDDRCPSCGLMNVGGGQPVHRPDCPDS